jgi:zinc protease
MSDRNLLRRGLLGLMMASCLGIAACDTDTGETATALPTPPAGTVATPSESGQAIANAKKAEATRLESLDELGDKPLARRELDIQSWQTEGGARVLFVEAHQLPMFDMRLTFAAGSSQDGEVPGLAMLTNAMLNEGVEGKDVTAIAEGFEGLGAEFGNGSYRDMAIASLRSLSAPDKREPALQLFSQVVGQASWPASRCSSSSTRTILTRTPARALQKPSPASTPINCAPFMTGPTPPVTP